MTRSMGAVVRGRARRRQRVVVAGMGDAGVPIAVRLGRHCDVVGISTRPALVSGQELGTRLADPPRWRASYFVPFSRFRGLDSVRFVHGRIASVDLDRQEVGIETASGETTTEAYDWLVISTGASNGFWRHDRLEDLTEVLTEHEDVANSISSASKLAVVGGGPSGVSVADNLARRGAQEVHLFHSADLPLPGYHPKTREWVAARLHEDGVHVHPNHRAETFDGFAADRITSGPIAWSTGQAPFEPDATIWAVGGVRPHTGFLPAEVLDSDGFVIVDRHLLMLQHRNVFAVGDVAATDPNRSSARNFGYRVVVANIHRLISGRGRTLRAFKAPKYRWGSVFGVQEDGLVIFQADGRRVRVPRWVAEQLLVRLFVHAYLYRTLRRSGR
ncbi:MAG: FAD-dependent oxidoreductase [Microthrixaceae bacterium]